VLQRETDNLVVKRLYTAYTKLVFPLYSITNRSFSLLYPIELDRICQILEFFVTTENKIETGGESWIKLGDAVLLINFTGPYRV